MPFDGNFPCVRDAKSGAGGYFVAATTERKGERARKDRCDASRYLDASKVPFFVVPIGLFSSVGIGDIAVGYAQTTAGPRLALGVVGDLGPSHKLGESSIAFNQTLLNEIEPPMNVRGVDKLDIDLKEEKGKGGIQEMFVLALPKTASLFKSDYSPANVERVARSALRRWDGGSDETARLADCVDSMPQNDITKLSSQ